MAHLSIWLLGPFLAELDGERLSGFRSAKVRALLSYLAIESHRPWGRSTLAGLLWPEFSEQAALSNLRNALSNLRRVIGDREADPPFLQISSETIQFNPNGDTWLDIRAFFELVPHTDLLSPDQVNINQLEGALVLYRGDFMEGFSVSSAPFEEWVLATRERARETLLQAVRLLATAHERSGELVAALDYIQRWIDLEPWDEAAYRHRIQILAADGQRSAALAQYEELCSRLAQDLGVAPESETVKLYEHIRSGQPVILPSVITQVPDLGVTTAIDPGPLPQFLTEEANVEVEPKLFVARQKELEQLEQGLESALQGNGCLRFVIGEPGAGKTALLEEFSRRAMQNHSKLLVFWGQCNAYTGQGDPYFPFLNITRMLAGEVESLLTGGVITLEHVQRLWKFLPETIASLLDFGPDLIHRFLSGGEKPSLAQLHSGITPHMLESLNSQLKGRPQGSPQPRSQQTALFEQFTQVMTTLSRRHPLLIILDDLQWIDSVSVNLLFHLGRHLGGSKILLLGAYRPEEVSMGREGKPRPLEGIVQELGVLYGDISVDLMQSEGTDFVDALLDSEPNVLSPVFRRKLYQRTSGHPLFTIELLRGMQLRGEIVRDRQGKWVEGQQLNWEQLPARVEAVIAQRIHHLSEDCQRILNVACVEGDQFTAEVVAHVLGEEEGQVHNLLSQEISKRHRLVAAQGLKQVGEQQLSTYRFRHSLFQTYLYNNLDVLEKIHLHGKIGAELEGIYSQDQGRSPEIVHTLAHHYRKAKVREKAVEYMLQAGDQVRALYAFRDAVNYYQRALALLNETQNYNEIAHIQMKLGMAYQGLFDFAKAHRAYEESFVTSRRALNVKQAVQPTAPHALRMSLSVHPLDASLALALDPLYYNYGADAGILQSQLFSCLLELTPDNDILPDVARDWQVLEDGSKYIFHLREDVFWSDGVPVTASDFEFSWKRMLDPVISSVDTAEYLNDIKGVAAFQGGRCGLDEVGIHSLDSKTLLVEVERPTAYFLHLITTLRPVPRHSVETLGSAWSEPDKIVTYGPFCLEAWDEEKSLTFFRNPKYRGNVLGNVERAKMLVPFEPEVALTMHEEGKLDVLALKEINVDDVALVRRYAGHIMTLPASSYYVALDPFHPPFNDKRVRQAFAFATDREGLMQSLWRGFYLPANGGIIPPGVPGHTEGIALPFDPEHARQLLGEAGYPDGRGFPSVGTLSGNYKSVVLMDEILKQQWKTHLGVDITWQYVDMTTKFWKVDSLPNLYRVGVGTDFDPDIQFRTFVKFVFRADSWGNSRFDGLVEQARYCRDYPERMRLYRQAEEILLDDAVVIPLYYQYDPYLIQPWIKNFTVSFAGNWYWKHVIIEPH